jgi:hypothetical protein
VAFWLGISGDRQIQSFRGPLVFLFLGVLSAALSIASDSAVIRIPVKHVKGWAPERVKCVKVGYMYESNYGPVYLAIAPTICFFGFAALRSVQRWDKLAKAAKGNRLVFNRAIVAGLILGSFGVTFGSEFMPYRARAGHVVWGDYGGLAFGYVQAHAIGKYESGKGIPAPREVKSPDPGLNENNDLIVAEAPNGPHGVFQISIFYVFLATALTTQALYACVLWWILLKFIFILVFILLAVTKLPWLSARFGADVALLNPLDGDQKLFGLGPFMESLRDILIMFSIAGLVNIVHFSTTQSMLGMRGPSGIGLVALVIALAIIPFYIVLSFFLYSYKQALLGKWYQDKQQETDIERRKKLDEDIRTLKQQNVLFVKELPKIGIAAVLLIFAVILHLPSSWQPKCMVGAIAPVKSMKNRWQSLCEFVVPCRIGACTDSTDNPQHRLL